MKTQSKKSRCASNDAVHLAQRATAAMSLSRSFCCQRQPRRWSQPLSSGRRSMWLTTASPSDYRITLTARESLSMVKARFVGSDKKVSPSRLLRTRQNLLLGKSKTELEMSKADITARDGTWTVLSTNTEHTINQANTTASPVRSIFFPRFLDMSLTLRPLT